MLNLEIENRELFKAIIHKLRDRKKGINRICKKDIHKGYNSWTNLWMLTCQNKKKAEEFEHWGWKNVHALYMLGH